MRNPIRALISLLILMLALPALAQETTPEPAPERQIVLNEPITVKLADGPADLIYTASGAETVTVSARSLEEEMLDITLEVLDTRRVRLAFNDDHGTSRTDLDSFDSLIEDLELPVAGDYIIRVNTFNGAGEGSVEVLVSDTNATAESTDAPSDTASTGGSETVPGEVPDNESFIYEFDAVANEIVTVTVRATDNVLDPRVSLLNAAGDTLISNDDHSSDDSTLGRYDSRISSFAIPEAGTYTLEISGFGGTGGEFELTIDRGDGSSGQGENPETNSIEAVQVLEGSVTLEEDYEYSFDAEAGDVLTITAQAASSELDVDVWVYDENDEVVGNNYDHGSSDASLGFYDARITNLVIQESGRYQVMVTGYEAGTSEFAEGDLTLTIERVMTGAPLGEGDEQVFLGELEANGTTQQTFEAQAGDFVTISVRSLNDNLDPLVDLLSPDGVILANNDDHGSRSGSLGRLDARISNFIIPEDGTYTAEVGGYRDSAGAFAITITILR
jgi:hypothetical protein